MVFVPSTPVDRDTLVKTARDMRDASGGKLMTMKKFLADSGLRRCDILNHFATWNDLLREAGYWITSPKSISPDLLLDDWGRVVLKLKHRPTQSEYRLHGTYTIVTFQRSFPDWSSVPDAYRKLAEKLPVYAEPLPFIHIDAPTHFRNPTGRPPSNALKPGRRIPARPACGLTLDFGPLRHEPVNEQGVVFAFGILAERLGFMVEAFQVTFPDCQAKRRIPEGWQHVNIEFEYESKNFRTHGHPPEGCDLIVCWRHNWPDCPNNLEVISLSDEIKRLSPGGTLRN